MNEQIKSSFTKAIFLVQTELSLSHVALLATENLEDDKALEVIEHLITAFSSIYDSIIVDFSQPPGEVIAKSMSEIYNEFIVSLELISSSSKISLENQEKAKSLLRKLVSLETRNCPNKPFC